MCTYTYNSKELLTRHMHQDHSEWEKCKITEAESVEEKNNSIQEEIQSEAEYTLLITNNLFCKVCNKTFAQANNLKRLYNCHLNSDVVDNI